MRFGLEFLRGDPDRGAWFGGVVSTSQIIAVVLVLGVAVLLPRRAAIAAPRPSPEEPIVAGRRGIRRADAASVVDESSDEARRSAQLGRLAGAAAAQPAPGAASRP